MISLGLGLALAGAALPTAASGASRASARIGKPTAARGVPTTSRNGRDDDNGRNLLLLGSYPWFHIKPAETTSIVPEPALGAGVDPDVEWREIDQKAIRSFKFKNVAQGQDGDCWLLSSIVASAATRNLDVNGALVKNPARRSLTIRTFKDSGVPVHKEIARTLPINTRTLQLAYATSLDYNPTIAFLEKGYAAGHGGYDAINGGWPGLGLSRVTGYKHMTMPMTGPPKAAPDFLEKTLKLAAKHGLATVFSTGQATALTGLETDHAYAVVRPIFWDTKTKQYMIGLKNPWGFGVPGDDADKYIIQRKNTYSRGEFDIAVSALAANFDQVAMAGKAILKTVDYTGFEKGFAKRKDAGPSTWKVRPSRTTFEAIAANLL